VVLVRDVPRHPSRTVIAIHSATVVGLPVQKLRGHRFVLHPRLNIGADYRAAGIQGIGFGDGLRLVHHVRRVVGAVDAQGHDAADQDVDRLGLHPKLRGDGRGPTRGHGNLALQWIALNGHAARPDQWNVDVAVDGGGQDSGDGDVTAVQPDRVLVRLTNLVCSRYLEAVQASHNDLEHVQVGGISVGVVASRVFRSDKHGASVRACGVCTCRDAPRGRRVCSRLHAAPVLSVRRQAHLVAVNVPELHDLPPESMARDACA